MYFEITLFQLLQSMHKFLTETREVVVMVMVKRSEIILGGILCPYVESVKGDFSHEATITFRFPYEIVVSFGAIMQICDFARCQNTRGMA